MKWKKKLYVHNTFLPPTTILCTNFNTEILFFCLFVFLEMMAIYSTKRKSYTFW